MVKARSNAYISGWFACACHYPLWRGMVRSTNPPLLLLLVDHMFVRCGRKGS
jgi:hypothetical protein